MTTAERVDKRGAGLLMYSEGEILLLLRSAKSGNPLTWGLPGGNIDEGETPMDAALREAKEELGDVLPPYVIKSEIHTYRGKNQQKHFVVFVVSIHPDDKTVFIPKLNKEHVEFRWFSVNEIPDIPNLHPVVKKLFDEHGVSLNAALQS